MEMIVSAAVLLGLATSGSPSAMQIVIPFAGDVERKVITYTCEDVENAFDVEYINASPNFLAIVPVGGERLIFAGVMAADGARYVSAAFEWWTHGGDASFADLRMKLADPVACTEKNEIP